MLNDIWMLYKCIYECTYVLYMFVSCVHACLFLCVGVLWKYKSDVERGESDLKRSGKLGNGIYVTGYRGGQSRGELGGNEWQHYVKTHTHRLFMIKPIT